MQLNIASVILAILTLALGMLAAMMALVMSHKSSSTDAATGYGILSLIMFIATLIGTYNILAIR